MGAQVSEIRRARRASYWRRIAADTDTGKVT